MLRTVSPASCLAILALSLPWASAEAPPPREGMADVGGRKLDYRVHGQGSPPVVLVSGAGAPQEYWEPVVSRLASKTTVFTYDRPGYGKSELGDAPVDGKRTAEDLHALLGKAGIPGPYILVGHSYGGGIVRLFASLYPEEMAGLILEDAQHEDIFEAHKALMTGKDLETFERMSSMRPSGIPDALRMEQEARPVTTEQLRSSKPLPKIPYTVITAGKRPPWSMFSEETARKMTQAGLDHQKKLVALIPGGKHVVLKEAGHNLHHEVPEVVVGEITEMLGKVKG